MSSTLSFGKFNGKSINEVASIDKSYLQWLVGQSSFKEKNSQLFNEALEALGMKVEEVKLDLVSFGKLRGQPVSELLKDTKYCEWLVQQAFFKKNSLYSTVMKHLNKDSSSIYEKGSSGIVIPGDKGTVSFGKMKGKPVAELLADVGYCRFLMRQDWFSKNSLYAKVKDVVSKHPEDEDRDQEPETPPSDGGYESPPPETPPSSGGYESPPPETPTSD